MKLLVVAVGVRMPAWVQDAWKDYAKRLPHDHAIELREIKPESRTTGKTPAQMMASEAPRIEGVVPPHALRLGLAEHGQDLTTQKSEERRVGQGGVNTCRTRGAPS